MSQLYEYYNTGDNTWLQVYGAIWEAQTFTQVVACKIYSVKIKMYRVGLPGTLTVSIRATDGNGHPTGADLCSGTTNGNTLPTVEPGEWREIVFSTRPILNAGTKYAIVLRAPSGTSSKWIVYKADDSSPTYTGGNDERSTNSGSSWTAYTNRDGQFEEWGDSPYDPPTPYTDPADEITYQSAKLHATLLDDGGEACQMRFNYGKTQSYGTNTDWQTGKVTNDQIEQLIESLDDDTEYHFRVEAENSGGTTYGDDVEFTTLEAPPPEGIQVKVRITHPALMQIVVMFFGEVIASFDNLSNLDEGRIESSVELPVPTPCTIEVTTLADQTFTYQIPLKT